MTLAMDLLAPVGYLGLLLVRNSVRSVSPRNPRERFFFEPKKMPKVFNWPMASPPYAKLSARIFALLPLQDISPGKKHGRIWVGGLAGLGGFCKQKKPWGNDGKLMASTVDVWLVISASLGQALVVVGLAGLKSFPVPRWGLL